MITRLTTRSHHNRLFGIPVRVWLWLLLGFYALVAGTFSVINPIFEAPDEHHHFFAARYIVQHRQLPVAEAGTLHRQEGAQPPLYYLLAAAVTMPWPVAPNEGQFALNPQARTGIQHAENNFNVFVHPPSEDWPWQGVALLVHLLRFGSVLLGAGSLLCIYATARIIWRAQPRIALFAVALTAALPQWLFLHSAVTNDTLLIFLVTLTHCYLARLWFTPMRRHHALTLGILIGLAILTKNTGLLLLPYTALFLLAKARGRINAQWVEMGALVVLPVLVLTGWHFWRNFTLYGDPTATNQFIELGGGERQLPAWFIVQHLDLLWLSTIAFFGWMNVLAPMWVFGVWIALFIGALIGILWAFFQRKKTHLPSDDNPTGILALQLLWPLLVFGAWFQFNLRTPAEQGRLLFPAIIPVALWLGYAFSQWRPRLLSIIGIVAAMTTALYCVVVLVPAAYPRRIVLDAPPPAATQLNQPMGLGIELVAAQAHTPQLHPGEAARFTLYWRATAPVVESPLVAPELLGRQLHRVGELRPAYQGGGMFPARDWPVGAVIAENLTIRVTDDARVPTIGRLYLRLQDQEPLVNAGVIKIVPEQWPAPSPTLRAALDGGIGIAQATLTTTTSFPGAMVPLHVRWQISAKIATPLNTFVHLGLPGQPPLAQADGPALGGDYPAQFWDKGETFDDEYELTLPADLPFGDYAVMIGLYKLESGERVPLFVQGERQLADALVVEWISVIKP